MDQQHDGPAPGQGSLPDNVIRGRFRQASTKVGLIVETRSADGEVVASARYDVVRPQAAVRRHEQLVRMVTSQIPDARITLASEREVQFACRGYTIHSFYEDGDRQPA